MVNQEGLYHLNLTRAVYAKNIDAYDAQNTLRPLHNVASEGKIRNGVSVPFFMGITGVNEHTEPVFNAVLPNAVIIPSG